MGDLTVIIPTWNRCDLLRTCLLSLQLQSRPCSILVVDNGSTDDTPSLLRHEFPDVQTLRLDRNLGFARAVNAGIRESDSPWLALLNNDTEAEAHWVESGMAALRDLPEFAFFASRILNYHRRDRTDSAGDCYNRCGMPYKRGLGSPAERYADREPVPAASAGAAFYRRSLFDAVGLFDETFHMYLEDVELSLRAQGAGLRCLYLPEAVVYHIEAGSDPDRPSCGADPGGSTFYSRRRVFWITRNRWQLMILYQPIRHLPWLAYGWVRSGLFHLFKAGFFFSFLRGLAAGMLLTPSALRKRNRRRQQGFDSGYLCRLIQRC